MSRAASLGFVVIMVVGMTGAIPGTAAGAATTIQVDQNPFTTGCSVSVNATAATPGNDLTFVVDADTDGTITSDEHLGTVTSNDTTGLGSVSFAPRAFLSGGVSAVNLSVVEETSSDGTDDSSYPVSTIGATYDRNLTLSVDGTTPTISSYSVTNPTGTDVLVSFNSSEDLCDVSAAVSGTEDGTLETADFTGHSRGGGYVYTATYFPDGPGNFTVSLANATDGANNNGAGGEMAAVIAGTAHRNQEELLGRPATVYLGETDLDLRSVTTGRTVTLTGVTGAADGTVVNTDVTDFDVTDTAGVSTGGYNLSGGQTTDIHVRDPEITDLTLALGDGSAEVDVTNGTVPTSKTVTVSAAYTFDTAEDLTVTVTGPDGVDVTPELADTPLIPGSDEELALDFPAADLDPGTYTVTVEGQTLDVADTATVTVTARETTLALSRTTVTRGASVRATAFGSTGANVTLRIHERGLREGLGPANASEVFGDTGDVESRMGIGGEYAAVEVGLGRDGIGTVLLRSGTLSPNATVSIEVLDDPIASAGRGSAIDSVPLTVRQRQVSISDAPTSVQVGTDFTVSGRVPQAETVKLYALVDQAWIPLAGATTEWATDSVSGDGAFTIEADSGSVIDLPDTYRVAAVADPDHTVPGVEDNGQPGTNADDILSRTAMGDQIRTTVTLTTQATTFDLQLGRSRIAASGQDAITVTGTAPGASTVHLYRIGPRGASTGMAVSVDEGSFSHEITGVDQRGPHLVIGVAPGRDGTFAGGPPATLLLSLSGATQSEAVAIIRDRYEGPGMDDRLLEKPLRAASPTLTITTVVWTPAGETVQLTVAGTSNREAGHGIELTAANGDEVSASAVTTVHDADPTWNATLRVPAEATLTVLADDGDATAQRVITLSQTELEPISTATGPESPSSPSGDRSASPSTEPSESTTPTERPGTPGRETDAAGTDGADTQPIELGGLDVVPVAGVGSVAGLLVGWRWLLS